VPDKGQPGTRSGLGGDVSFSSYFTEAIWAPTLVLEGDLEGSGNGTLLQEVGDNPIPFDRRLQLGGIQSIRGTVNERSAQGPIR
jgi:hypothetical protein